MYILIIINLISMLKLSDDYCEKPDNDSGQPDHDSENPSWDQIPEPQIMEITPDPGEPALPPALEHSIITDILNNPDLFRLPENNKHEPVKSLN